MRLRPATTNVRVLVADDGVNVTRELRLILEDAGFEVCAEAADADAAVATAVQERPDICLIDIALPGGGIGAAAQIRAQLDQTPVLLLAETVRDDDLFDALRNGVSGFVLKSMDGARLPHVLRDVLDGEVALPRSFAGRLAQEFRNRGRRRYLAVPTERGVELTLREWEVLDLLRRGLSTREVAMRLGLNPVTVRRHVSSALKKLGVETRSAALALFAERSVS